MYQKPWWEPSGLPSCFHLLAMATPSKGLSKFQTPFCLPLLSSPVLRLPWRWRWSVSNRLLFSADPGSTQRGLLSFPSPRSLNASSSFLLLPGTRVFFSPFFSLHRWFRTLIPVWAHRPLSWEKRPFLPCAYFRGQQTMMGRPILIHLFGCVAQGIRTVFIVYIYFYLKFLVGTFSETKSHSVVQAGLELSM